MLSLTDFATATASRRRFLCGCTTAGLLGRAWRPAYAATPASASEEAASIEMRPVQVADGAWFVQGQAALGSAANQNFISNAGFVVTPAGVVVIDALGSPPLARRLLAEIAKITPQPVRYVIATHYHADHIYGLQVFSQAGATVIAHVAAREYLASDTARLRLQASRQDLFPWIDETTRLVEPDRWVGVPDAKADTTLELGGVRFLIRPVGPAHTPEDLVVFLPDRGVLYGGDLLFRGRIPFVGQADSRAWIAALDRLLALKPRVLVPGHGAASTEPLADIALTRDYLQFLRERMGAAARELEPFEEAYARTDWSRFAGLPLFQAANRMNAYNTYLLMEQEPADRP
ncbi:MBL fold metallo-hydrolase [Ideonella sp.]|uniref:MBL fold metallo-hydrolase n=1 Tax=Ideonella sp. TaxID=1929293 RepID=UPI0039C88AD5